MSLEQQAFRASLEKPSPLYSHFLLPSEQGYVHAVTVGKTHPVKTACMEHTLVRSSLQPLK